MILKNRLHYHRTTKGLTQKEVSDGVGIGISAYRNHERHVRPIKPKHHEKYCEFFGITLSELLDI